MKQKRKKEKGKRKNRREWRREEKGKGGRRRTGWKGLNESFAQDTMDGGGERLEGKRRAIRRRNGGGRGVGRCTAIGATKAAEG